MSAASVNRLANEGVFTVLRNGPAKTGRRLYLLPAEVEAYAVGGLEALAKVKPANS